MRNTLGRFSANQWHLFNHSVITMYEQVIVTLVRLRHAATQWVNTCSAFLVISLPPSPSSPCWSIQLGKIHSQKHVCVCTKSMHIYRCHHSPPTITNGHRTQVVCLRSTSFSKPVTPVCRKSCAVSPNQRHATASVALTRRWSRSWQGTRCSNCLPSVPPGLVRKWRLRRKGWGRS